VRVAHDVIDVGFAPHRLAVAGGALWVASYSGAVHRVGFTDEAGQLLAEVGSVVTAATVSHRRVFVGDNRGSRVLVYDQRSGRQRRGLQMPGPVRGVLSALGSVWVTAGDSLVQLDPSSLQRRSVTPVGGEVAQLAVAGKLIVVTNRTDSQVTSVNAAGRVVGVAEAGGPTIGVVVTDRQIWVLRTDRPEATILSRERFAPIGVAALPGVAYDATPVGDEVWLTLHDEDTVARVSSAGAVLGQFEVGHQPLGIVATAGNVWVANEGESSLWRIAADLATVGG
jgi:hypothetical protein